MSDDEGRGRDGGRVAPPKAARIETPTGGDLDTGTASPSGAPQPAGEPSRVRVTAPRAGTAASARSSAHAGVEAPTSDIRGVYVRSLIRSQLRLGLVMAVGFAAATALFVLAIAFAPVLDETFVAGVPLSWLLLGLGVYPLAITVGALYVRAAARNEARYRSLTEDE